MRSLKKAIIGACIGVAFLLAGHLRNRATSATPEALQLEFLLMSALGGAVVGVLAQHVPRFSRLGAFGEYLRWAALASVGFLVVFARDIIRERSFDSVWVALFFGVGLGGGIAATARRMRDIEEA